MGNPVPQEPSVAPEMKFCVDCGQKIMRRAEICPRCGCRQTALPTGKKPYKGIGLSTMGLIACAGIVGYLIASWVIDAITSAVSEQGVAPVLKFCIICFIGISGLKREIWG